MKNHLKIIVTISFFTLVLSGFACDNPSSDYGDPLSRTPWSTASKIKALDAAVGDMFGYSVAIDGDYLVVGALEDDHSGLNMAGSVYVFRRTGINSWDSGTKLTAADAASMDWFGYSVAISGDYVVVGANGDDDHGSRSGSVYVFRRIGINHWDAGVKLTATDGAANDRFGDSVAICGDYIVVGACYNDDAGISSGSAYMFRRTGINAWDGGYKILPSDGAAEDHFGHSVSIHQSYLAIGATGCDSTQLNTGAVYVYYRTGIDTLDGGFKITASDAMTGDVFGSAVSISGDYLAIGALGNDSPSPEEGSGSAYIYRKTGPNSWDSEFQVRPGDNAAEEFGESLALSGDFLVVGSYKNSNPGFESGAAYIFERVALNTWTIGEIQKGTPARANERFGNSVSISGGYAIIGAYGNDDFSHNAGAAYVLY